MSQPTIKQSKAAAQVSRKIDSLAWQYSSLHNDISTGQARDGIRALLNAASRRYSVSATWVSLSRGLGINNVPADGKQIKALMGWAQSSGLVEIRTAVMPLPSKVKGQDASYVEANVFTLANVGRKIVNKATASDPTHFVSPKQTRSWSGLTRTSDLGSTEYLIGKANEDDLAREGSDASIVPGYVIENVNRLSRQQYQLNKLGKAWLAMQTEANRPERANKRKRALADKRSNGLWQEKRAVQFSKAASQKRIVSHAVRDAEDPEKGKELAQGIGMMAWAEIGSDYDSFLSEIAFAALDSALDDWDLKNERLAKTVLKRQHSTQQKVLEQKLDAAKAIDDAGKVCFDVTMDGRGRLYMRGLLNPQDGIGRWLLSPAGASGIMLEEAQHAVEKHAAKLNAGTGNLTREDYQRASREAESDHKAYMMFMDLEAGSFNSKLWAAYRTLSIAEANPRERKLIEMDASSSGIQCAAALLLDEHGAALSNLILNDDPEEVADCYTEILIAFAANLESAGLDLGLPACPGELKAKYRDVGKNVTLPCLYGSTNKAALNAILAQWPDMSGEELQTAILCLWEAVGQTLPAVMQLIGWTAKCVQAYHDAGKRNPAQLGPLGTRMMVSSLGKLPKKRESIPRIGQDGKQIGNAIKPKVPDESKQPKLGTPKTSRALFANMVQSCDAAVMHKTLHLFNAMHPKAKITAIHDAFIVQQRYRRDIVTCYQQAFVDVFQDDHLSNLRDELAVGIEGFPAAPEMGSWDVNTTLSARHCLN